jgi:hypothetical protein
MKCVNCPNSAHYSVVEPGVRPADYCNNCLPKSLRPRAEAGQLTLRAVESEVTETSEPAQTKKKTAKKAAAPTPVEPSEVSDEDNQN